MQLLFLVFLRVSCQCNAVPASGEALGCMHARLCEEVEKMLKEWEVGAQSLEVEFLRLLPREVLVREMTVLGGLIVNGLCKIEFLDDHTRSHVEIVANDLHQLVGALV